MDGARILDLDKIVPPKKAFILSGQEIDVSKIPSKVSLELAKNWEAMTDEENPESFDLIMDAVMAIIKPFNEGITRDWILENTFLDQLLELISFVMTPIRKRVQTSKNKKAPVRKK